MSVLMWQVEWSRAGADLRGIALRVLGALAIALVIATGALPNGTGSAAFAVLFVGYGLLRAAMSIFQDERSGLAGRVLSGGVPPSAYLLQKAAASAALSFVGLLPALGVVELTVQASAGPSLVALAVIALSLWIACVLGVVVGSMSASATEVLVLSGVALVLALHMSGVFSDPSPGGTGALLESLSPFGALHEAFVSTEAGRSLTGIPAAAGWALVPAVAVWLFAARLTTSRVRG